MYRLSRRSLILCTIPGFVAALGACTMRERRAPTGTTPPGGATPLLDAAAVPPVAPSPTALLTPTMARIATPAAAHPTLPPMPYRTVSYRPATTILGVPDYFYAPASLPDDPLNDEVMRAFWRYCEIRYDGEAALRTGRYPEVLAEDALRQALTTIDTLRAGGAGRRYVAVIPLVRASPGAVLATSFDEVKPLLLRRMDDDAELYVTFDASPILVDPASGKWAGRVPDRGEEIEGFYRLRRFGDGWKVVSVAFGPFPS